MNNKIKLHPVLERQLTRLKLTSESQPKDILIWQELLSRVNNRYVEADQERYLLERSMEISSKEQLELNRQIVITARRAGMADVATSILHNVGNILNSVNVSLGLLQENIHEGKYQKLFAIIAMMKAHAESDNSLATYLIEHPKGKLIPEYLLKLGELLESEYNVFSKEIEHLGDHLEHIKDIVAMQKNLSGVSGVSETIYLPEIIETALKMGGNSFEDKHIRLQKNYDKTPFISTDGSKLLQILVNLIQNAKEAVLAGPEKNEREIILTIQEPVFGTVLFTLKDNGIGIATQDLTKIFSFGFTTKQDGHGFGLHSAALAAKELGGSLNVESAGLNQGATFKLTLPLTAPEKKEESNELRN